MISTPSILNYVYLILNTTELESHRSPRELSWSLAFVGNKNLVCHHISDCNWRQIKLPCFNYMFSYFFRKIKPVLLRFIIVASHKRHDISDDRNMNRLFNSLFRLTTTRQIWGIWKLRLAYSPETANLDQNRWCFVLCDFEIWCMTLKNNRGSLLCCFKLCATFHSHLWIQTGVTVRKRPIRVKIDAFLAVWPWNLTYDLQKQ